MLGCVDVWLWEKEIRFWVGRKLTQLRWGAARAAETYSARWASNPPMSLNLTGSSRPTAPGTLQVPSH